MANILSVAATAATSSTVTLLDGASANLVLMVSSGTMPKLAEAIVYCSTSGTDTELARLTAQSPGCKVIGPGTYKVTRLPGQTFGVDSL